MSSINESKVGIITGGTKGIGFAIAKDMLDDGMKVVITGRSREGIDKALGELGSENAIGFAIDVRDYDAQVNMINEVASKWGRVDVLIANAGIGHFKSIIDLTTDEWNETIDVNLTGVFNSVKSSISELEKTKGYIITIASLAGTNFFANGSAYNASKFGLVGFTQAIMMDLRQKGIKCSTIMPGSVSTYFNGRTPSEADDWKIQPADIAQITMDLLKMNPRTLPSKIEVRPSMPPNKK